MISLIFKSYPPLHSSKMHFSVFPLSPSASWSPPHPSSPTPVSRTCRSDPCPPNADSRCSLTLLALLPASLPGAPDTHKHTPAGNNGGFIQGGHAADTAGSLSGTGIWTWASTVPAPHCSGDLLKSAPVRAAHAASLLSFGLAMTSSGEVGYYLKDIIALALFVCLIRKKSGLWFRLLSFIFLIFKQILPLFNWSFNWPSSSDIIAQIRCFCGNIPQLHRWMKWAE